MKKRLPKYQTATPDCGNGYVWNPWLQKCEPVSAAWTNFTPINSTVPSNNSMYTIDYSKNTKTPDVTMATPQPSPYEFRSNNNIGYSDTFKGINTILDGVRFLGNVGNSYDDRQEERERLRKARLKSMETGYNINENGVNNIPVYFQYGGENDNEEDLEEMKTGGIPDRYKNKGFTKVGVKRKSTRPGKKWMVLAKKGDSYKVVHGGDSSMQDYTQHKDKQRRKNFWNRMGRTNDVFSPRFWHAKFGTWQSGGEVNSTGYLDNTPTAKNPYNIIPSNEITMNGVSQNIMAYPNVGNPVLMQANSGKYNFPNADYVLEVPEFKTGGKNVVIKGKPMYKRADGKIVKRGLWSNTYLSKKQNGGEQEELAEMLNMYAQMKNITIDQLSKQLEQVPEKQLEQVMQQIVQEVQQAMVQQQDVTQQPQQKMQDGGGLVFTPVANTVQGSTTPTGRNNALSPQLTPEVLYEFAKKNKIDTSSNEAFQRGLKKLYPEIVESVMSNNEFGNTAAGDFVDGKLGARTFTVINRIPNQVPAPQQIPYGKFREPFYNPANGHLQALGYYTPNSELNIVMVDKNGQQLRDKVYKIPQGEFLNNVTGGGKRILQAQNNLEEELAPYKFQQGGSIPISPSVDRNNANAETEAGEIIQRQDGNIVKVSDNDNVHENGGSMQPFVARVLEDTADKRKDKDSKLLRITPQEAEAIVGFKPKKTTSHSKLFEIATNHYESKLKAAENKIKTNLDYIKYSKGGKYAENSLNLNIQNLNTIPTKAHLFDAIYNHQEEVKQKYSIGNSEEKQEMRYGGNKLPKYQNGTDDDVFDLFYAGLVGDGYTGSKSIKDMQNYLVSNYPNLVDDYMTRVANTNKGINKKVKGKEAFADGLWDYRHLIPQQKPFTDKASYDNFIKNKTKITNNGVDYYIDPIQDANKGLVYYNPTLLTNTTSTPNVNTPIIDLDINSLTGVQQPIPGPYTTPPPGPYTVTSTTPQVTTNATTNTSSKGYSPMDVKTGPLPKTEASRFYEPLRAYDIAGATLKFIDATQATPVEFEQYKRDPLRVREVNPLPALLNNQGSFNAALEQLPTSGVGFANQAGLLGNKYKMVNDVLGQYENTNKGRKDQIDQYNDQQQFALQQANMQLRDQFTGRVLQRNELQRQQKFAALDGLFTKIAQNRKLNREGQLIMEMYPYFDQNGQFNGNRFDITKNPQTGLLDIYEKGTNKKVTSVTENEYGEQGRLKAGKSK